MNTFDEGLDNHGLRVTINADYHYDQHISGNFSETIMEPSTDDLAGMFVRLIEGVYGWGVSRAEIIDKLKQSLDDVND